MSKMRRLLRKLHIGARQSSPEYPSSPSAPAVTTPLDSPTDLTSDGGVDSGNFRLLEEEYQFQLALAISASGTDPTEGPMPGPDSVQPVECLSLQYWNYNVVNYDEKVTDGFYDVYGISSNANMQGKMPSLADLQVIPHSDRTDYEVVVVNRAVDPELQQLERRAISIALDCQTPEHGPTVYDLVQKIADLVVGSMGGPVCDVNDILRRWTTWSSELQTSLDSIVFPLGCLEVGLSSHRALLFKVTGPCFLRSQGLAFKVLADKINLPCRLVKGSYYTGTDDGAVNLIKLDQGSEYIVDLMGAPGTLIPAEIPHSHLQSSGSGVLSSSIIKQVVTDLSVPCDNSEYIVDLMGAPGTLIPAEIPHSHHQNSGSDVLSSSIIKQVVNDLSVALDKKVNCQFGKNTGKLEGNLCEPRLVSTALGSGLGVVSGDDIHHAKRISWRFEHGFGKLIPSLSLANLHGRSSETEETLSAEKKRAQDVSEYIMSVSQKPEFTDKLHAILLDREASQTPDLLSDLNPPLDLFDAKTLDQTCSNEGSKMDQEPEVANFLFPLSKFKSSMLADCGKRRQKFAAPITWSQGFENSSPNSSSMNKLGFDCADLHFPVDPVVSPIVSFPCMGASEWFVRADSKSSGGVDSAPNHLSSTVITRMYGRQVQESSRYTERIKSSTKQCQEEMKKCVETANSDLPNIGIGALSDRINLLFDDVAEWEVQCEDLQIGELIGLSSFGEVYRADWNDTEVVVKKFLDHDFSGDAVEQFRREITLMPRLRHPNIVLFMGAVSRPPNLTILTEFLPRGTLYGLLHRPNIQLNEKRRLRMALDVVKGMNYLHSSRPSIVHRDLKSPNLLVDKDWVVKVSDFGLARLQHHAFLPSNSAAGTPEWMAPEVLRNEPSSEKCDIYSFGVILWELATLRMPWSGMSPLQVVGAVGFQNRRLDIPEEVDPMVAQIISDCCHSDPNLRPSFAQLIAPVKHLKQLLSEIT